MLFRSLVERVLERQTQALLSKRQLAQALDPHLALARGFAIVRNAQGKAVRQHSQLKPDDIVEITMSDAVASAQIRQVKALKKS